MGDMFEFEKELFFDCRTFVLHNDFKTVKLKITKFMTLDSKKLHIFSETLENYTTNGHCIVKVFEKPKYFITDLSKEKCLSKLNVDVDGDSEFTDSKNIDNFWLFDNYNNAMYVANLENGTVGKLMVGICVKIDYDDVDISTLIDSIGFMIGNALHCINRDDLSFEDVRTMYIKLNNLLKYSFKDMS